MSLDDKKVINGWTMYDWANSVYNLVITTTIFPAYYVAVTSDKDPKTADYVDFLGMRFINSSLSDYTFALAILIVAFLSPILSSIADYKGNKKAFMSFFCLLGSMSCSALFFFRGIETLWVGIFFTITACIGFWSSLVFYNSYLPEIASYDRRDAVSAKGFTMGYIGSVLMQIICFVFVFKPEWFGMQNDGTLPARFSFLLVGVWWLGFAQITLRRLPKSTPAATRPGHSIFTNGFIELKKVWNEVKKQPLLKRYLSAYFFYNMGVQTVMLVSSIFGGKELHLATEKLIIVFLIIQLVAIVGAWGMAKISAKLGNLVTLIGVVFVWILICIAAYYITVLHEGGVDVEFHFYALAVVAGLVMGGVQSLSRSTYSKLMPVTKDTASYFSFYDVTEKIAIVIGMFSFGLIEELTGSMKNSILFVMIFFIIGVALLFYALGWHKRQIQTA